MRIGLDLDGVVIDSEKNFRVYEEIYAIEDLGKEIVNREEPKYQRRYDWTDEEKNKFIQKYLLEAALESHLMAGFLPVYKRLKEMGHEFIVITARGGYIEEMKDDALRLLNENNLEFEGYHFHILDKLKICQEENIDVMIDDDYHIIKQISDANIKTLYFRDTNLKKIEENEYIHEVNNWGDVYRYFSKK